MIRPPLDRSALGRALTRLANATPAQLMAHPVPAPDALRARRIGLTGAPGAGKSTLAGHLALALSRTRRVGVLAVDPSSPRSGGAILGDRIRMDELQGAADLYIRSVASRSTTDGLSDHLPEMLDTLDAHGFDDVLLETVGVGQAEHAARAQVDTLVLVLLPESGDVVQVMKAGIMELADVYVVNKADLPGAQKMATDIQRILAISRRGEGAWRPRVVLASAQQPQTHAALLAAIDEHQAWLDQGGLRQTLRADRARYRLRRLVERRTAEVIASLGEDLLSRPLDHQLAHVLERLGAGGAPSKLTTGESS